MIRDSWAKYYTSLRYYVSSAGILRSKLELGREYSGNMLLPRKKDSRGNRVWFMVRKRKVYVGTFQFPSSNSGFLPGPFSWFQPGRSVPETRPHVNFLHVNLWFHFPEDTTYLSERYSWNILLSRLEWDFSDLIDRRQLVPTAAGFNWHHKKN